MIEKFLNASEKFIHEHLQQHSTHMALTNHSTRCDQKKHKCKEAFLQARAGGKWCENKKLAALFHGRALIVEISKAQRVETDMKHYE